MTRTIGLGVPTLLPVASDFADSLQASAVVISGQAGWRTNCLSSFRFTVGSGTTSIIVNEINNLFGGTATSDLGLGLYIDGAWSQALTPTQKGWQRFYVALDGNAHTIEIYSPYQQFDAAVVGNVLGVFVQSVEVYGGSAAIALPTGITARMGYYCDSIGCTGAASPGTRYGYIPRLRQVYPGRIAAEGWGGRSLFDDMPGGGNHWGFNDLDLLTARMVGLVAGAARRDIVVAIGENDYKGAKQTAAAYQAGLTSLLTKLHAADAGATLYVQTLTITTDEGVANGLGDTPASFRTAQTTAASGLATVINGLNLMTSGGLSDFAHPTTLGHQAIFDGTGGFGSTSNLRTVFSV